MKVEGGNWWGQGSTNYVYRNKKRELKKDGDLRLWLRTDGDDGGE